MVLDDVRASSKVGRVSGAGSEELFAREAQEIGYGTLDNISARRWYLQKETQIPELLDLSLSLEDQAKHAALLRNQARTQARNLMKDKVLAEKLNVLEVNMSWEKLCEKYYSKGFYGDEIYEEIIKSSQRSREDVNNILGIKGGKIND